MFLGKWLFLIFFSIGFLVQASAYAQDSSKTYFKGIYSFPLSLDPIKMNDTASLTVANLIYDGLLKFSPTLKIEGALADTWSTSKDGRTLRFQLKTNIFFHSGEAITAADVEFSLKRALSPESKVRKFYDSIKEIRAIDDKNLEIELQYPFPPFLSVLAGATAKVLPRSKVLDPNFFHSPIGSGPFKFIGINQSKKEMSLEAFSKFHAGKPKIDCLILKETTQDAALELAKSGNIHDLSSWPLTENDPIFRIGQKVSSPVASTWIIGMNTLKPPFDNLNTRQLFKVSFPVETFRQSFYPDSVKANGYVPNGLSGSQVKIDLNVKWARPIRKKITIAIPAELARAKDMKVLVEKEMSNRGWNVEVELMAWNSLMDGYAKKSHQAFLVAMNMDYPDADFLLKNFESDNVDNFSGLKNAKLDEILKKSRATQDRKIRETYYFEALKLTEKSAVTVNLFHPRANYWISNCVQKFRPNILSDVYIDYTNVSLSTNCLPDKVAE